ncbi:hypothetical protein AMS68_002750 [Peltaster fructicola]|uniref:triacylglycerol lipase n=1 Tax=Peltaster fructicola TaxID=286661 RepID=A0A6H0XRA3_9PEZI|nr:hypothetical protein AMS68_002750 [Peltaster fructicola]
MAWQRFGVLLACALRCVAVYEAGQVPLITPSRVFTLRQVHHHGVHKYPYLHRYADVQVSGPLHITDEYGETLINHDPRYFIRDDFMTTLRPVYSSHDHGHRSQDDAMPISWLQDERRGPAVTDKQTVLSFAKMAANAYARKDNSSEWKWIDVGSGFNYTDDFGWENDGLRGHVFADEQNQTVVISIKGTSVSWLDPPDTVHRDVLNDNLFASCCCAQGWPWLGKAVCNCRTGWNTCNSTCLTAALRTRTSYYWAAKELYHNITMLYPDADIWMTGHSLGGVVSSLLGLTFGLPTLTFEAYPDALAASRLGLATPPDYSPGRPGERGLHAPHVYHYGHTADPIFMGTCNGLFSTCNSWGYALESKCHTGVQCIYDTAKDLGWRQDVRAHSIVKVIEDVLDVYDDVPECTRETQCTDCGKWKFETGHHG